MGLADNLLTSAALASRAPLVLAPAMNNRMYEHPATQRNLRLLRDRGARIAEPGTGSLASRGEWGVGRLAEPPEILSLIETALGEGEFRPRSMDGLRVLVTAGGTREPIDSVRYVGNRSSGRMGLALAEEASRRGAEVILVCANVALPRPESARTLDVETSAELEAAVSAEFPAADVLLMAAAPADFRPAAPVDDKIAKAGRAGLTVELEPTADILATVAAGRRPGQTLVGFAAEHGELAIERGREKLGPQGSGRRGGQRHLAARHRLRQRRQRGHNRQRGRGAAVPKGPKTEVAGAVLDEVERLRARAGTPSTFEGET